MWLIICRGLHSKSAGWGIAVTTSNYTVSSDLHADELILTTLLRRSKVKLGQSERRADLVAGVRVKKQCHSTSAKVAVSIDVPSSRVNLRICPEVADSLYVDHYQLVTGTLKREMTECLKQQISMEFRPDTEYHNKIQISMEFRPDTEYDNKIQVQQ